MNFKKLSMASIGLAAFLFSCSCGGKVEYTWDMMKADVDAGTDEASLNSINEKYRGNKIRAVGNLGDGDFDKEYQLDATQCVIRDEDGSHYIDLKDEDQYVPIFDSVALDLVPKSTRFYKTKDGYSFSATEGEYSGDITMGLNLVITSMNAGSIHVTYTLIKN